MKEHLPMVFSHANGFPAPCYAKMFGALKDDFDIRYLPRLAHNPAYPVSDGWPELTHELIEFIEQGPHPAGLGDQGGSIADSAWRGAGAARCTTHGPLSRACRAHDQALWFYRPRYSGARHT